jgi:hypothetical protein
VVSLASAGGCGSQGSMAAEPTSIFADEALLATAAASPELLAEARAARARADAALEATEVDAAADYATEARLLLLAAAADGERRLTLAPAPALAGPPEEDLHARRHALAVAVAAEQAEASTAAAGAFESTRWRRREADLVAARRAAVEPLAGRIEVLLAALAAFDGAEPAELAPLAARLEALKAEGAREAAAQGLDRLRAELEARLARPGGVDPALAAAALEAERALEPIDGLLAVDLGPAGADGALTGDTLDRARRLAAALGPRPLLLVLESPSARGASSEALAARLRARLVEAGLPAERLAAVVIASGGAGPRVSLRFLGYPAPPER